MTRGRPSQTGEGGARGTEQEGSVGIDAAELDGTFSAPQWLRDVGLTSWLLVGAVLLVVGVIGLLALTEAIVMPLIAAGMVAGVVALTGVMILAIVGGITSQADDLESRLSEAKSTLSGWATDLGVVRAPPRKRRTT